jgi:hypothetical protein
MNTPAQGFTVIGSFLEQKMDGGAKLRRPFFAESFEIVCQAIMLSRDTPASEIFISK